MKASDNSETVFAWQQFLIAFWTVGAAFAAAFLLSPVIRQQASPLFLLAVMISAWQGGLRAGLLATVLSAVASAFVFIPPAFSFNIEFNDWLELLVFTFAAVLTGSLSASRKRLLAREQRVRREAERANAVKDEFLAAVSHELRTPLTTIKTLTRVMQRRVITETEKQEYLADIASECDRQIDLVLNLLDLSRIKAEGVNIELQPIDVQAVLEACQKIERFAAEERNHSLEVECESELPPVLGNHGALRRALCTIVENAIKYTAPGGAVRVRAFLRDSRVTIEVADNGRGIGEADLPFIFDRFYRGQIEQAAASGGASAPDAPLETEEIPGAGLGLHLARVLIEGMNGEISVSSRLGAGSTFTVRLLPHGDKVPLKDHNGAVSQLEATNVVSPRRAAKTSLTDNLTV
jgi:signal transduction histidine kinase